MWFKTVLDFIQIFCYNYCYQPASSVVKCLYLATEDKYSIQCICLDSITMFRTYITLVNNRLKYLSIAVEQKEHVQFLHLVIQMSGSGSGWMSLYTVQPWLWLYHYTHFYFQMNSNLLYRACEVFVQITSMCVCVHVRALRYSLDGSWLKRFDSNPDD